MRQKKSLRLIKVRTKRITRYGSDDYGDSYKNNVPLIIVESIGTLLWWNYTTRYFCRVPSDVKVTRKTFVNGIVTLTHPRKGELKRTIKSNLLIAHYYENNHLMTCDGSSDCPWFDWSGRPFIYLFIY